MKLIKFASLACMATLALGIYSAKAVITTNYDIVNFALTGKVQALNNTNSTANTNLYTSTSTPFKIANKDLLTLMSSWTNSNNFPAGSFLAWDWDSFQVVVLAKDGSNILFYANSLTNGYLYVNWYSAGDLTSMEKKLNANPGYDNYTYNTQGSFELFSMNGNIDLYGSGANTETWSEHWVTQNTANDIWNDTQIFNLNGGVGTLQGRNAVFGGVITAKGHGRY
jgi:hypothetical protein